MARRLIAHIGAAKTGTTAFQIWMKAHRGELLDAGYLTPPRSSALGSNRGLIEAMASADGDGDDRRRARLRKEFAAEVKAYPEHDIIMSAEPLSHATEPISVAAFSAAVSKIAAERIAVLVVRDPVAHFNTGFAQRRKAMLDNVRDFATDFEDALAVGRADWRAVVAKYEAHGFTVAVLPYDQRFTTQGAVRSILSHPVFGDLASRFDLPGPAIANPSMGAIGLIIMDLILDRALAEAHDENSVAPEQLRAKVVELAARRFADRPFNGMTPAMRTRLIETRAAANAWIADRYFDAPWDEVLPPAPEAPVSPRTVDDLPAPVARQVRAVADRMIAWCRTKGWLGLG